MQGARFVYVQEGMQEGLVSYHLSETAGCWISYSTSNYLLDNGQKPPEKKYWDNANFNIADRSFYGIIDFRETPIFNGMVHWIYNFTLAEDYQTIESGSCHYTYENGKEGTMYFNKHLFYTLLRIEPGVA